MPTTINAAETAAMSSTAPSAIETAKLQASLLALCMLDQQGGVYAHLWAIQPARQA